MMFKNFCAFFLASSMVIFLCKVSVSQNMQFGRPNIVWLTAEDMSPEYIEFAQTPNIDRLKEKGTNYTRAFATNPVCSPSRSTLITGVRATTMGSHQLRSPFAIPGFIKGFPSFMREIGYYTTNNVKTDYNTSDEQRLIEESWDGNSSIAHWRNRSNPSQPFFSVFNYMHTHQSRIGFLDQTFPEIEQYLGTHNPDKVAIPPYYPDTPTVRKTIARSYDCITAMDNEVGKVLDQLEADGKMDSTIVFFFSDHGVGLPRGKRLLYDSGLQVSLIVYVPQAFRDQIPITEGEEDKLVSFIDFAPTVLKLAGLTPPDYMQGEPFLEESSESRNYVFGARDRVDEAIDLSRSVRTERYLYIQNYYPYISWNAPEFYSDLAPLRREITKLAKAGQLNRAQMTYAGPDKPAEELFDTREDPYQIHNLADSQEHEELLKKMRLRLRTWQLAKRDLGFIPEEELYRQSQNGKIPWEIARDREEYPLNRILKAAALVGRSDAVETQVRLLRNGHPIERYWAVVGLQAMGKEAPEKARAALSSTLNDEIDYVRIAAAGALLALGTESAKSIKILSRSLESENPALALRAARILQLLDEKSRPAREKMERVRDELSNAEFSTYRFYTCTSLDEVLKSFQKSGKKSCQ